MHTTSALFWALLSTSSASAGRVRPPPPPAAAQTFQNPVIYEDFADNDVSVGPDGAYYFSASNMHYSPGAPILRSEDLVNWDFIGHSVPTLDFGPEYNLTNGRRYRGGTWASTLRYRESNGLWYWIGCVDFWYTYIYTAPAVTGPWTKSAVLPGGTCYYDCGLLIDTADADAKQEAAANDTMYVVYGGTEVHVAQLAADGLSQVKAQSVLNATDVHQDGIEGNRMYKRNGTYYILNDHPGDTTYIWKSDSPWGPFESKILVQNARSPVPGGGAPHQGSLVKVPGSEDDWYYMSFTWAYPAGRMPVLAPVVWGDDGFPSLVADANGGWGAQYPLPLPAKAGTVTSKWTGRDTFLGPVLGPDWEWNHNPDPTKYGLKDKGKGLTLSTATVTNDFYSARNTLTHRIHGEYPVGTIKVNISSMADGDRFGLAAFRDRTAYIGVHRAGATNTLALVYNITQDESTWATTGNGTVVASKTLGAKTTALWLRAELDARASGTFAANFSYSLDGKKFATLGAVKPYTMWTNWAYFMGYRFGIFNYATKALGGSVFVEYFDNA